MNRRISLAALLVLVVLVGGWFALVFRPDQSHLKTAHAAQAKAEATRAQLESQLGGLHRLQRNLPADESELNHILPALPVDPGVDSTIDQIEGAANSTGVSWSSESQSLATTGGAANTTGSVVGGAAGVSTLTMTIAVQGTYPEVTQFVTLLGERPRLLVLDSINFAPSPGSVSATINLRAFYDATPVPDIAELAART